jgi:Flp pilus assembly protein TadD
MVWRIWKESKMSINNGCFLPSLTFVFLTACASPTIAPDSNILSTEVLLRAEPLLAGEADVPELDDIDVLALNQEMLAFLDKHVNRQHQRTLKLHSLVYAVISEGDFGLEYDETTRTAQETFQARLGNCLSFTNMFVALAREAGIEVTYQEVEIPPDWSLEGDTYVLNRHVNVYIDLGHAGTKVVDFNIDDFQSSYDRRLISDERALAHYYSNVGVEHMQKQEPLQALRYFRKAVASDHEFAPVWGNLGALYARAGYFEYAEAAYVRALEIDSQDLVAMSNLGRLYKSLGQTERAEWYDKKTNLHRMRNPYYRYHLAREAFLARDYDAAIGHLKYSVRKKKNEDTFHILMGLSYLQKGNEVTARRWLDKAEQATEDDGLKSEYHSKLEMLLSAQE